jgi:hypothetical protein
LFKEFAEKQLVIVNRPPTLHKEILWLIEVILYEKDCELVNARCGILSYSAIGEI